MVGFDLDDFAREAVWFAKQLEHEKTFSVEEVRKAVEFISLSEAEASGAASSVRSLSLRWTSS